MSDSRPTVVLFGAATVVAALFARWGALEVNDAVRAGLAQQTGALPEVIGNVTREMIGLLPDRIVGNGWEVIDKGDWVMPVCAILAVIAAFSARLGLAQLASSATILAILWVMVGPRGEFGEYVSLQWGAWLGLAGAGLMMIGACMRAPKPTQSGRDQAARCS